MNKTIVPYNDSATCKMEEKKVIYLFIYLRPEFLQELIHKSTAMMSSSAIILYMFIALCILKKINNTKYTEMNNHNAFNIFIYSEIV